VVAVLVQLVVLRLRLSQEQAALELQTALQVPL
jgi:hypothetical protein